MKASLRARRMARNHRRMQKVEKLNLVPIIDIFTMLLFFLMVNSGEVEMLEADKAIQLPASVSDKRPEDALVIKVNDKDILVQDRKVADVAAVLASPEDSVVPLRKALDLWAARKLQLTDREKERGRAVTIMGDQEIPYLLLKRVMTTCAQADYRDISLAVTKLPEDGEQGKPAAAPAPAAAQGA